MKPETQAVLEKAQDKLRVSELLLNQEAWDDAASRAYYAAFHAVTALHLFNGHSYSSHAQSIGQFNKVFVKSGRFPKEFTMILARLFEDRQSADYDVLCKISEEEARRDVADAGRLVSSISEFLTAEE